MLLPVIRARPRAAIAGRRGASDTVTATSVLLAVAVCRSLPPAGASARIVLAPIFRVSALWRRLTPMIAHTVIQVVSVVELLAERTCDPIAVDRTSPTVGVHHAQVIALLLGGLRGRHEESLAGAAVAVALKSLHDAVDVRPTVFVGGRLDRRVELLP